MLMTNSWSFFLIIAAIIIWYIRYYKIRNKRDNRAANFLESLNPILGIEENLDLILAKVQGIVKATNFTFYMYDSSQENYVLKAVRKSINDTIIAPSYSGLLPYEKQHIKFAMTYPKGNFPSETLLVTEGEVSMVLMPIRGEMGFVKIGPIKKIPKKDIKILNEYSAILEIPIKKLVEECVNNDKRSRIDLQTSNRKERMLLAENYALYYGYGKMEELSQFDLIIVEPSGFTIPEFKRLKNNNKVIFTYLSLFEVHPMDNIFQDLTKDDLLFVDGEPLKNYDFGTYLVNLQSKKWMDHLLKNVQHHLEELEADGLFLDTIGDIESSSIPASIKRIQMDAIINFLHVLKILYPTHLLIQNNGLNTVCLETAPYIDGICWENPSFSLPETKEWTDLIVQRLSLFKKEFQMKVFLLLEETLENERKAYSTAKDIAKAKDFLVYNAPVNYVEAINVLTR